MGEQNTMTNPRFMWNSVDGGENLFIKDREAESDKKIHIKIIDGKYEFKEFMDTVNELSSEIERLEKIIQLANYQLKVQDRILKECGE